MTRSPGPEPDGRGVRAWSSDAWLATAMAWVDEALAAAGRSRSGAAEQPHLRPWATVLRVPTRDGPVWMKAAARGTAFEAALYELLARTVPERVLTPIAASPSRGWLLLPDGGLSLGERLDGVELVEALAAALPEYGRLQRALEPHVGELLALGVADMRPAAMPGRFQEAVTAVRAISEQRTDAAGLEVVRRVAAMEETVAGWCERLGASPGSPSLDHNDLHPWNVLDGGRFYDWGDSVIAHPFAAMLVPLGFVAQRLGGGLEDPGFVRARDAYLDVWADFAPRAELIETLELACQVAKIARVLTWDRSLQAAREQGEEVEENWATAPLESLEALLDPGHLGRA